MIQTKLYNPEYSSYEENTVVVYFAGQLKFEENLIHHANEIYQVLKKDDGIIDKNHVFKFLRASNGCFSIIIVNGDQCFAASDIVRSLPLFYVKDGDGILTDNLSKTGFDFALDDEKVEEYVACGLVTGNNTIYKNVIGVQAGEMVYIKNNEIKPSRYFEFLPNRVSKEYENAKEFAKEYDQILLESFSNMVELTPNINRWIVPLSGGHDSRETMNLLYRLKLKNVICYSYGTPNNEQSKISKMVAESLGYEWHFVEYTEDKWKQLHDSGLIEEYITYSFNGTSTPHLQDFLAVYELKKRNILKKGDVFVKSHGDFVAGNHLKYGDLNAKTEADAMQRVISTHTRITSGKSLPYQRIYNVLNKRQISPKHFQEYYNWQERQAKFVVNSIRVYEFLGFRTCLPFWDRVNVDFWLSVSPEQRVERSIFLEGEKYGILDEKIRDIPFSKVISAPSKKSIKGLIISLLPKSFTNLLLRITGRKPSLNEGLNQIYALKAKTVSDLVGPLNDFPKKSRFYFKDIYKRYCYQVTSFRITSLYALRLNVFNKKN